MRRVAFDVSVLAEREPTGVARAAEELLRALAAAEHELELVLVSPRRIPERAAAAAPRARCAAVRTRGPLRLWRELAAPGFVRREGIDLWHSPVTAFPVRARCARIATVHELAFLEPDCGARDGEGTLVQRLRLALAARYATRVICPSEHTRKRFAERFPDAAARVQCVPHGVSAEFSKARPLENRAEPYVLCLGAVREKKDPLAVLEAFAAARTALRAPLRLVFAGPPGSSSAALARAIEELRLRDHVHVAGFVPEGELPGLIAGARALFLLSRSEGCGLPVLEAQAAGVPVIAASAGALPETTAGAARLVAPGDAASAARALVELERHPREREQLVQRGRAAAAQRTWKQSAAALLAIWRAALTTTQA